MKQKRCLSKQPGLNEVRLCKLPLRGRSTGLTLSMTPNHRQQNPSPPKRTEGCPMSYLPALANKSLGSRAAASCVTGSCLAQLSHLFQLSLQSLALNPLRRCRLVKLVFPHRHPQYFGSQHLPLNSTTGSAGSDHDDCCLGLNIHLPTIAKCR